MEWYTKNLLSSAEEVFNYRTPAPDHEWVFRGERDSSWILQTHLERVILRFSGEQLPKVSEANYGDKMLEVTRRVLKTGLGDYPVSRIEGGLLRKFKRQSHGYLTNPPRNNSVLEWLSIMQHFGAPTRLLDWTHSFYVALYFAVVDSEDQSAVWAIDHDWLCERDEKVNSDVWKLIDGKVETGDPNVEKRKTFREVFQKEIQWVIPVNPYRHNERLIIQQGTFLVPGNITSPFQDNLLELIRKTRSDSKDRVIKLEITGDHKEKIEILKRLHRMNMNAATLKPGFEGFCQSLTGLLAYPRMLVRDRYWDR